MDANRDSVDLNSAKTPYGKVIGIVENRKQFQTVSEELSKLGAHQVDAYEGNPGINLLSGEQDTVSQSFLGDMDAEMMKRYLDAVKNGQIVFSAVVAPEVVDQAAETAKAQGASEVVHFGAWVITNY